MPVLVPAARSGPGCRHPPSASAAAEALCGGPPARWRNAGASIAASPPARHGHAFVPAPPREPPPSSITRAGARNTIRSALAALRSRPGRQGAEDARSLADAEAAAVLESGARPRMPVYDRWRPGEGAGSGGSTPTGSVRNSRAGSDASSRCGRRPGSSAGSAYDNDNSDSLSEGGGEAAAGRGAACGLSFMTQESVGYPEESDMRQLASLCDPPFFVVLVATTILSAIGARASAGSGSAAERLAAQCGATDSGSGWAAAAEQLAECGGRTVIHSLRRFDITAAEPAARAKLQKLLVHPLVRDAGGWAAGGEGVEAAGCIAACRLLRWVQQQNALWRRHWRGSSGQAWSADSSPAASPCAAGGGRGAAAAARHHSQPHPLTIQSAPLHRQRRRSRGGGSSCRGGGSTLCSAAAPSAGNAKFCDSDSDGDSCGSALSGSCASLLSGASVSSASVCSSVRGGDSRVVVHLHRLERLRPAAAASLAATKSPSSGAWLPERLEESPRAAPHYSLTTSACGAPKTPYSAPAVSGFGCGGGGGGSGSRGAGGSRGRVAAAGGGDVSAGAGAFLAPSLFFARSPSRGRSSTAAAGGSGTAAAGCDGSRFPGGKKAAQLMLSPSHGALFSERGRRMREVECVSKECPTTEEGEWQGSGLWGSYGGARAQEPLSTGAFACHLGEGGLGQLDSPITRGRGC